MANDPNDLLNLTMTEEVDRSVTNSDAGGDIQCPDEGSVQTAETPKSLYTSSLKPPDEGSSSGGTKSIAVDAEKTHEEKNVTENAQVTQNAESEEHQLSLDAVRVKMSENDIKSAIIFGLSQIMMKQLDETFEQANQPAQEQGVLLQRIDIRNITETAENISGNTDGEATVIYWQILVNKVEEYSTIKESMRYMQQKINNILYGDQQEGDGERSIRSIVPSMEEIEEYEQNAIERLDEKSGSCKTVKFAREVATNEVKFITNDDVPVPCFRVLLLTYMIWNRIDERMQGNLNGLNMPKADRLRASVKKSLKDAKEHLFNMVVKHIVIAEWNIKDPQKFQLAMSDVCKYVERGSLASGTMTHGRVKNLKIIKDLIGFRITVN